MLHSVANHVHARALNTSSQHQLYIQPVLMCLARLQRRFDRLRALQKRLHMPASGLFDACGRRYKLPLPAKAAKQCSRVPERVLQYLGGLFDGDGCVATSKTSIQLSLEQSESGAAVLLLLRNVLGGGIYRKGEQPGMRQRYLRWTACSDNARHAAATLLHSASCKHSQLQIVANNCVQDMPKVKALKLISPMEAACTSWSYLAGFFDSEGSIHLQYPAAICLQITQKFPNILCAIQGFLADAGISCSISKDRNYHKLSICRTEASKDVLRRLLASGLRIKRASAKIALELARGDFHNVRSRQIIHIGYQSRYIRLSAAGAERAYNINKQARICSQGRRRYHEVLDQKRPQHVQQQEEEEKTKKRERQRLQLMRDHHHLMNVAESCALLRSDIRLQLKQGARIR